MATILDNATVMINLEVNTHAEPAGFVTDLNATWLENVINYVKTLEGAYYVTHTEVWNALEKEFLK